MLTYKEIEEIAVQAAADTIGARHILHAIVTPTTNAAGEDAIGITLVIKPSAHKALLAGKSLDTLVLILERLGALKDDRWPIISYATEEDLAYDVDSES